MQYMQNNFSSPFFEINVGIGQGSVLSPILLALYLLLLFYIFEKHVKNLKIPVSFLFFVNNKLFISQEKSFEKTKLFLFCSYNIISSLLDQFGLVIEHGKTEAFHFSRSHSIFNPSPLDLSTTGSLVLTPNTAWQYLDFIFNRKLTFCQHINFYTNKALSMVKSIKMLGNSTHRLLPYQKHLLYKMYILPITLYGFLLQFYNKDATIVSN